MKKIRILTKKVLSFIMSVILIFTLTTPSFAANTNILDEGIQETSFIDQDGNEVYIKVTSNSNIATSEVYVNGRLTQSSTADRAMKTIYTDIYDINTNEKMFASPSVTKTGNMNGFQTFTNHKAVSNITIDTTVQISRAPSIYDEPVENTGLQESAYNDGYYFLGKAGGYYYAPSTYGYLYRDYSKTYDGETHSWSWGAGETLSAIGAYIGLFGGPVSAIIGLLIFTGSAVLSYNQSVELATYTFDYDYKVRVSGSIHFTTNRNITYWKIENTTENTVKWEQKRFNYGFSMANSEMVKAGVDNYLLSIQ